MCLSLRCHPDLAAGEREPALSERSESNGDLTSRCDDTFTMQPTHAAASPLASLSPSHEFVVVGMTPFIIKNRRFSRLTRSKQLP